MSKYLIACKILSKRDRKKYLSISFIENSPFVKVTTQSDLQDNQTRPYVSYDSFGFLAIENKLYPVLDLTEPGG